MDTRRSYTIRPARTTREREAIFNLRYRIYVQEMQRPQKDADHHRQRIEDALDDHSVLYGAWVGEAIIGTIRSIRKGMEYFLAIYPTPVWKTAYERALGLHQSSAAA